MTRAASASHNPPRIVGVGASAGGLVALEAFFTHARADTGIAYIVVQHLAPTQKAMLPTLLQRVTTMPVREAQHRMPVAANCIYVIPPNAELRLVAGLLHLEAPVEPRGMRLPINVLFTSLASCLGDRAIGVVLSGMGSDGTLGMQAIKAVGGLTCVQQPETAQFDSMPRSAIDAGCADIVASAEALASRIEACVEQLSDPAPTVGATADSDGSPAAALRVVELLRARTQHDFSMYKTSTLHRRIQRRMMIHNIPTLRLYADFLERNEQEADLLFNELLIGVTSYFRDPTVWEYLVESALPALLRRRDPSQPFRAWVVGCSTGEEAYSLAIAVLEAAAKQPEWGAIDLQIFASDLSPDAIATARRGDYPLTIADHVPAELLARYFSRHESGFRVNPVIRDRVLFAQHDVVLDPPFTRLDVLACRNLLIYFDTTLQRRLIPMFHYCLRPGGLLLLGNSETVGRQTSLFAPVAPGFRIYTRQDIPRTQGPEFVLNAFPPHAPDTKELPMSAPNVPADKADSLEGAANQVLLQVYSPPAILVNSDGDIVYINGRTGPYLEPAAGKANWNIHAMARPGLRKPLSQALEQAKAQAQAVHLHGVQFAESGPGRSVDITVQCLQQPEVLRGKTLMVFHQVGRKADQRRRKGSRDATEATHEAEGQPYRDEITSLREEARISSEALQASYEELQSTNEELQSTNEELTTSKEEMQSMNEELQTINNELQVKLDDLALAQSDMQNVLNSIEIAILFLDQNLNIRRYTEPAATIINLRESDVGRPLSDLTTILEYPALQADATETLRTLRSSEKQIKASDGRWFSVRIMPYRRLDNVIDGVVITLLDITETKALEARLRQDAEP